MSNEDHLLAEIQADPNNAAAKLVYADWLEERGDGRAEIIQVREKLKTLSPLDQPYWDLKDRFRGLRDEQEPEWLAAMQYDAVYRPMFTTLPDDRGQRWRLVEEFIELWHQPLTRASGYTDDELEEEEHRLDVRLPAALREWYQLAGKRLDVLSCNSSYQFRSPAEMVVQSIDFVDAFVVLDSLKEGTSLDYVPNWGFSSSDIQNSDPGFRNLWLGQCGDPANSFGCTSSMVIVLLFNSVFQFGELGVTVPWNTVRDSDFGELQEVDLPDWSQEFVYGRVYEGIDGLLKQPSFPLPVRVAMRSDRARSCLPADVRSYLDEMHVETE